MKTKIALLMLGLFSLGGCADMGTKYGPMGLTGGYEDRRTSADSYRIIMGGNGMVSLAEIEGMAMLRAAEVTQQNDFDRFVVTDNQIGIGSADIVEGLRGNQKMLFWPKGEPNMSRLYQSAGLTPAEAYDGPASIRAPNYEKPGGWIDIKMLKANDPAAATAIDAKELVAKLKPRYAG